MSLVSAADVAMNELQLLKEKLQRPKFLCSVVCRVMSPALLVQTEPEVRSASPAGLRPAHQVRLPGDTEVRSQPGVHLLSMNESLEANTISSLGSEQHHRVVTHRIADRTQGTRNRILQVLKVKPQGENLNFLLLLFCSSRQGFSA